MFLGNQLLARSGYGAGWAATILALGVLAGPLRAETVDLQFEPPQIEASSICSSRAPDEDLVARWTAWDGRSLAGMDPASVSRDLRRLRDMDPVGWYSKIDIAMKLLPSIEPGYSGDKMDLERAELMVAAGKQRELLALQLVPRLLSRDISSSPRMQLALSRMLDQGLGIEADPRRALELLVSAANAGNADALLELVSRQLAGDQIEGWDVDPEMAVTMAFGALVGQLDPMICDRVTRIAREYKNGDIVTRNMELSERWYRFAADLGDTSAAWKVSELHMRSEDMNKDNNALITYLTRAAESGTPYVEITLGRLYEIGALVPKDLTHAAELYDRAAANGDRSGMIRRTLFLASLAKEDPGYEIAHARSLQELAALDDAPSWAYTEQAAKILETKGRWAGEADAIPYLEKAAALDDGDAIAMLARFRLRLVTDIPGFYGEVDKVIRTVYSMGKIDPMASLQDTFTCRSPNAPQREEAAYWRQIEDATGTKTVDADMAEVEALIKSHDPLKLARLQSQALYGRPTAVALFRTYLDRSGAPAAERAFWAEYALRFDGAVLSQTVLTLKSAPTVAIWKTELAALRKLLADGDLEAGQHLAEALIKGPPRPADAEEYAPTAAEMAEATDALLPLANDGRGEAIALLSRTDPVRWPQDQVVQREFAKVIAARGDFAAIVFALPFVSQDPAMRADYLARATNSTTCVFDEALSMLEVAAKMKDDALFDKWLAIGDELTDGDGWRLALLGDQLRSRGLSQDRPRMLAYYDAASAKGNRTAVQRILSFVADETGPEYDPTRAAEMYATLATTGRPDEWVSALARLDKEGDAIRTIAYAAIHPVDIYRKAAQANDPIGMREYGLLLRDAAESAETLSEAGEWLARASQAGDGRAMIEYAEMLAYGIGGKQSPDEALVWLERAAGLGFEDAGRLVRSRRLEPTETQ
jgi:TPR repeat protein